MVNVTFPKYPGMERQDLTQGQLGSFKFTPVDITPDRSTTSIHGWNPFLAQIQAQDHLPQRHNIKAGQPHSTSNSIQNQFQHHPGMFSSPSRSSRPKGDHYQAGVQQAYMPHGQNRSHSPEMNPVATPFVPMQVSDLAYAGPDGLSISTQTMFRALVTEQQAHSQTKLRLENALAKIQELETDLSKRKEQVSSLCASVKMLGGIIKHRASQMNSEQRRLIDENIAPQDAPYAHTGTTTNMHAQIKDLLDDEDDGIVSFAQSPCKPAPASQSNETVYRHVKKISNHEPLLESSPQHLGDSAKAGKPETKPAWNTFSQQPGHFQNLAEKPSLTLPPSFMAKYQPPKVKLDENNLPGAAQAWKPDLLDTDTDLSQATDRVLKPVKNTVSDPIEQRNSPVDDPGDRKVEQQDDAKQVDQHSEASAAESQDSEPANGEVACTKNDTLVESASSSHPTIVEFVGPLKLKINWKITAENPIYSDDSSRENSRWREQQGYSDGSLYWRHPVRYLEYLAKNLFRTVMVDMIPLGASYSDILANIRDGAIEKIQLVGPIGVTVPYMTARIVFHYELSASRMASHARDHGMRVLGKPVRVWQVITQTYPKSAQLERDVFENMYTRLLLVNLKGASVGVEVRERMCALLPMKLKWLQNELIGLSKTVDGYDLIEFTSVQAATKAMEQLRRDEDFGGIELDFEDDPCAEPYSP